MSEECINVPVQSFKATTREAGLQPPLEYRERLSRWCVRLSALLLAIVFTNNAWQAYSQWQRLRSVRCDQPIFDFGHKGFGDVVEHTFHLTNTGRSALQIETVRTDCGCATVVKDLAGRWIAPGGSFDVPVKLSMPSGASREVERRIVLGLAGESAFQVTLRLRGELEVR